MLDVEVSLNNRPLTYIKEDLEYSVLTLNSIPVGIYMLKVNNRNTRTRFEICSKLTLKTRERR